MTLQTVQQLVIAEVACSVIREILRDRTAMSFGMADTDDGRRRIATA
jgi:hypothetical protein